MHRRLVALVFAALLPGAYAAPALAVEDRDNTAVTDWYWYTGVNEAQVNSLAGSNGLRIVDLKVENPGSGTKTFTVAFVKNAGTYARTWFWYYDITPANAYTFAINNNLRPVVVQAYEVAPGDTREAVVYIANSGGDQKAWWIYTGVSATDVVNATNSNNARLTSISRYTSSGQSRFAVIMIANTGADQTGWWWYYGIDLGTVNQLLGQNQARLVDLDADAASGTYSVIMTSCGAGCPRWWWWFGYSASQMTALADQYGARIVDANPYAGCGGLCFAAIMIDDATAIAHRVGDALRGATDGTTGLYLKQVGGPELAAIEKNFVYEPASAIKVAPHLYVMKQIQAGTSHTSDSIVKYQPPVSGSCPGNTVAGTETLDTAVREMLYHSDNTRTREITDTFGASNINAMMASIGMTSSAINHILGCGGPIPNTWTLANAALLYEGVETASLLDTSRRALFNSYMPGKAQFQYEGYDWTHLWDTDIPNMVAQEAPAQMTAAQKTAWLQQADLAYKAGNYKICGATCATYVDHIDIAGWAKVPFCSGSAYVPREYVFGLFVYNATSDTNSANAFNANKAELLREQIRAGLASCLRGDANGDHVVSVSDILYLISYLFAAGPAPVGWGDVNGDHAVNVNDILYLISYLFAAGPAPQ